MDLPAYPAECLLRRVIARLNVDQVRRDDDVVREGSRFYFRDVRVQKAELRRYGKLCDRGVRLLDLHYPYIANPEPGYARWVPAVEETA